ncbi:putative nuclease HARBI1 [Homalodisca vitripennis]|nr:putative nuclease HARBI1 [Homalodisca vitripennis]
MDEKTYFDLLRIVTPLITKQDTKMREAITPHEKLTATLRYLSTGRTMEDLKFSTRISPQTLGRIIPETCSAIVKALNDYCKVPNTAEEWKQIAQEYGEKWNFPNCLGSMDGKHIAITPPPGSGSYFYNYKGFHSQVLFCIASANYEIIYFHFGVNGRVSDGGVLKETDFNKKLTDKSLNLPEEGIVDGEALPYVFIADDAFPLTEVIMKPFSYRVANKPRKVYNYRLSRARRMVESVFGILAERFQVLQKPITFIDLKKVNSVVVACCYLHNYLRRTIPQRYSPKDWLDLDDDEVGVSKPGPRTSDHMALQVRQTDRPMASAKEVRNKFVHYFSNKGKVEWQDRYIS